MLTKNKCLFRFDSCLTLQNSFFFSFDIAFLLYIFRFFSLEFVFLLYRFRFISLDFEGGHLGWRSGSLDTIWKIDHLRTIHAMFALNWLTGFREEDF